MELRLARGRFGEGAMAVWMRMRGALVAGEAVSPLARALVAADSGNGVSVGLDLARFTFVNADITVSLLRPPSGAWVCLDARSRFEPDGVGLADTALYDERGVIGRVVQSLIVEPRR
jgi:acyl-CoA thioesterase